VSKETHFVKEGTIADVLEYNEESALWMRILTILEEFIGAFAKIEKTTISFDVSAVCLNLHGTVQLSLDGIKFGYSVIFKNLSRKVDFH
jgi:hypothetical protein